MDSNKVKYLAIVEILLKTAKELFKCKFRSGFLEILIEILKITMKVPDLQAIKYSYLLIGLVCRLLKDFKNAIFAIQKLIDFWEEEKEYTVVIQGLKILGGIFEYK